MIKIERVEVFGWNAALRGMRNPLNSWDRLDSTIFDDFVHLGDNDLRLLLNLCRAGESHRKVLRMMHIQMDVTAPLYWWKDYDTYKVSTVANSCSTMHKIHDKEFTMDDFAHEHLDGVGLALLETTIGVLNYYRDEFNEDRNNKEAWYSMIQLLPTSYMQRRTLDINYEVALKILIDRSNHKLDEFREITQFLLNNLPYMSDIYAAVTDK